MCDSCYGEFCKVCLVLPKGRRHPICTHCTLVLSGVRGHATVQPRGEKRTVKQRRAELAAAATQPSDDKVFRFFDADTQPDDPEADASGRRGGRRSPRRDRRSKGGLTGPGHGPTPSAAPLPMPAEVAAAAAELKAAANGPTGEHAVAEGGSRIGVGPRETTDRGPDGIDAADPTDLVTVTRAVARLEELRRKGASPTSSPVPDVPASSPAPEVPGAEVPAAAVPAAEAPSTPAATDEADVPPGADEPVADTGPARRAGPPPKPQIAPAPRSDRRRPTGADGEGQPPTAPMVSEVRTIGGRRSSDQAPPPQPARPRSTVAATTATTERPAVDDDELVNVSEALSGVERIDARQPSPVPAAADGSRKADTDSRGNWIPPILRGMAPDAREAKTNLPKRKRGA